MCSAAPATSPITWASATPPAARAAAARSSQRPGPKREKRWGETAANPWKASFRATSLLHSSHPGMWCSTTTPGRSTAPMGRAA